jgi:porin
VAAKQGHRVPRNSKGRSVEHFHGGFSANGIGYRSLLETAINVDLSKSLGWQGAQISASFHDYFDLDGSEAPIAEVQTYSNIDADQGNRIYELWFEQILAHQRIRIKFGRIDANTEFANVENATEFLNSSMGFSPTIQDMNTYPDLRLGALAAYTPNKFISVSAGIFRCLPSGSLVLGEAGTRWKISRRAAAGRLAVGFWAHPHSLEAFDGTTSSGVHGYYAVAEQTLWKRVDEIDDDARGIRAFIQWGNANPWFNEIANHLGEGFEWTGTFSRRPEDVIGLGVSTVWLGKDVDRSVSVGREHAIETFYMVHLQPWLSLTPDLQWIVNPSGSLDRPLAIAGSMRMVISF